MYLMYRALISISLDIFSSHSSDLQPIIALTLLQGIVHHTDSKRGFLSIGGVSGSFAKWCLYVLSFYFNVSCVPERGRPVASSIKCRGDFAEMSKNYSEQSHLSDVNFRGFPLKL